MGEHGLALDLSETFPHLANAPIVEAVIHWQARARKWEDTQEYRDRLAQRLIGYPTCHRQHALEMAMQIAPEGTMPPMGRHQPHGFRLVSADKCYIVQFTRDGVAFSRLEPYEQWEPFAAEAQRAWRAFVESAEPVEVQRLGVRFINRIGLDQLSGISFYLTSPPICLETIGLATTGFLYRSTHDVSGHPLQVNVVRTIQTPTPAQKDQFALIVDIDVGTTCPLPCDERQLQDWLNKMHWLKNKVFFSLLTAPAIARLEKG
jgi:uncharacterized protein (TIGR04255 family)